MTMTMIIPNIYMFYMFYFKNLNSVYFNILL